MLRHVASLRDGLRLDPRGYGLHPVAKAGGNPWTDRVLIGRAANNDIVLRCDAVSKLHAYLRGQSEAWLLYDARSANGTWMNGERVPAEADGAQVLAGASLRFGSLRCELLDSASLCAALLQ
jgi:pSer/pThr/pTyr-binding forkhead associated (FHA) protein